VLKVVPHSNLAILDPIWTTAYMSRNHGYMIYDTLFGTDENAKIKPQMVESWTEARQAAVDLQAAQGPGIPRRQARHRRRRDRLAQALGQARRDGSEALQFVQRMDSPAPDTFRIFLGEACGFVLEALGKPSSNVPFIMPKRVADTDRSSRSTTHRLGSVRLQARRVQARRQGRVPEERQVRAAQRAAVGHRRWQEGVRRPGRMEPGAA
jgi:peptide/nickel transport system substrate-binding protein